MRKLPERTTGSFLYEMIKFGKKAIYQGKHPLPVFFKSVYTPDFRLLSL